MHYINLYSLDSRNDIKFVSFFGSVPNDSVDHIQIPHKASRKSTLISQINDADLFKSALLELSKNWKPDIIFSHTGWGCGLWLRSLFPHSKLIAYSEWWFNSDLLQNYYRTNPFFKFGTKEIQKLLIRNLTASQELSYADLIISPTRWQRDQLPPLFKNNTKVLHDGVDTDFYRINTNYRLSNKIRITYATRGLELIRAFPQFVESIPVIIERFGDLVEFCIAGTGNIHYGGRPPKGFDNYLEWAQSYLSDFSNVRFLGWLDKVSYARLLKSSNIFIYLTHPFVPSWGLLHAMASGPLLVTNRTDCTLEFLSNSDQVIWTDDLYPHQISDSLSTAIQISSSNPKHGCEQNRSLLDPLSLSSTKSSRLKILA